MLLRNCGLPSVRDRSLRGSSEIRGLRGSGHDSRGANDRTNSSRDRSEPSPGDRRRGGPAARLRRRRGPASLLGAARRRAAMGSRSRWPRGIGARASHYGRLGRNWPLRTSPTPMLLSFSWQGRMRRTVTSTRSSPTTRAAAVRRWSSSRPPRSISVMRSTAAPRAARPGVRRPARRSPGWTRCAVHLWSVPRSDARRAAVRRVQGGAAPTDAKPCGVPHASGYHPSTVSTLAPTTPATPVRRCCSRSPDATPAVAGARRPTRPASSPGC